ncbi:MarR family winged helix-turn-helix transcriptional regulator [Rhizobium giardinii]|uniref:MarR family winged helix-turn-helix transcriptional regulator n=1 Tax=Rhizobium giardinii TaxID=56731 RepID=UPI003D6EC247
MAEDVVRAFGFLSLGTRMKRIGERLQADTQKIIDQMGVEIAASQYPLLAAVDRLGPLAIGDLADAMGVSQPGVTRSIAQLVDLGVLRAEPAPDDQRRKLVSLTAQGQQLVDEAKEAIWPRIEAAVADLCGKLDGPLLDQLAAIEDGLTALPLNRREPKP